MNVCEYDGEPFEEPRSHPWTNTVGSSRCRYLDLKAQPALIRTALEDFVPLSHHRAITRFYELLERLNGPTSLLESNDCSFSGPHPSEAPQIGKLQCAGRVMILHRELALNLSRRRVEELKNAILVPLSSLDPGFESGMVGATITPVRYLDLPADNDRNLGHQLMLSFWAWGDSDGEVMDNLERVMVSLSAVLALPATTP